MSIFPTFASTEASPLRARSVIVNDRVPREAASCRHMRQEDRKRLRPRITNAPALLRYRLCSRTRKDCDGGPQKSHQ
jgi:hypothetical protein